MKLMDRFGSITETALNLMMVTKLMKPTSVEALKKTGLIGGGSTGGGFDNPFSIEKERRNIYSGRAELEPDEQNALDDFCSSLKWWEYLEFFEKFGDYDTTVPRAPRLPQNQQSPKQYSQMAGKLRTMLDAGQTSSGYDNAEIHKGLEELLGLFKKTILNPYYDLYKAAEKLNLKKLFDKIKQVNFQDVAQKVDSFWGKLAKKIDESAKK